MQRDENGEERVRLIDKIRMIKEKRHGQVKVRNRSKKRDFMVKLPIVN